MKYTVRQTFNVIGDPHESTHKTIKAANKAARMLRSEIVEMLKGVRVYWAYLLDNRVEREALDAAYRAAKKQKRATYGSDIAEFLAYAAVEIVESEGE